jgi:hypothetical protein
MAGIPNIADLRYSGLYLPLFTLAFIRDEMGLPQAVPIIQEYMPMDLILSDSNFPIIFSITLLGCVISHGTKRSIFGTEAAKMNPKNKWVVRWYQALLYWKPRPGRFPDSPDDLPDKIDSSVSWFQNLTPIEKIIASFLRLTRFTVFYSSTAVTKIVAISTTLVLLGYFASGGSSYLGLILLVSQLVFFFGSLIFNRFPSVVPPQSAEWLYLPEYEKSEQMYEENDIEFRYQPEILGDGLFDNLPDVEGQLDYQKPPDVEYLVKLDDQSKEDGEYEYLVPIEDERSD